MNLVCLIGRITKDAVIEKVGKDQISKATFNLAVNRDYKNAEGKYEADFPRIIAWKSTADYLQKYAPKGTMLEVVGKIQTGSYTKDGKTVYTSDIVADTVKVISGNSSVATHNAPANHTNNNVDDISYNDIDITNNDLPF